MPRCSGPERQFERNGRTETESMTTAVKPRTSDSFDEIDYGREFQDYLDPGYRTQEIEYKDDAPSFRTVSDAFAES